MRDVKDKADSLGAPASQARLSRAPAPASDQPCAPRPPVLAPLALPIRSAFAFKKQTRQKELLREKQGGG